MKKTVFRTNTCSTCEFCDERGNNVPITYVCRRNPPSSDGQIMMKQIPGGFEPETVAVTSWPEIKPQVDWCGAFQPKAADMQ